MGQKIKIACAEKFFSKVEFFTHKKPIFRKIDFEKLPHVMEIYMKRNKKQKKTKK